MSPTGPRTLVAVVSTSRADLGPLSSVLAELLRTPGVEPTVWTGVSFDVDALRAAAAAEGVALPATVAVEALAAPVHVQDAASAVAAGPALAAGAARVLRERRPAVVVVLGDRWELLHVVPAVVLAGVPLVHLHGGEVTAGAVDERVRHAVTKLADAHCVADAEAAARVRQLGEPAADVHVTGAPGRDRLRRARPFDEVAFAERFGVPLRRPLVACTVHPETAGAVDNAALADAVLQAVLEVAGTTVVTHPGQDAGRDDVLAAIAAVADRAGVAVVPSLGADYARLLVTADAVVGNSSSGVLEAPAAGVPSVDVGARQCGRPAGPAVQRCGPDVADVRAALARALDPRTRERARTRAPAPAAPAVVRVVLAAAADGPRRKAFVDLPDRPSSPLDGPLPDHVPGGAA